MPVKKVGFEGKCYYGVAGASAGVEITNSRDMSETTDYEEGDVTERGDGSSPPISVARVTGITWGFEFQMLEKSSDTTLAALKAAAAAGTPVAFKTKSHSTGKGYDGDVIVKYKQGTPLRGEQTVDFTVKPNDDNRTPQLNVV